MPLLAEAGVLEVAAAPSLWGAMFRLGAAVAGFALLAGLWLHFQKRFRAAKRELEVVDRAALTRGASVAILRVGNRRLLLGVSTDGVRLLRELDAEGDPGQAASFQEVFSDAASRAEVGR